MIFLRKLRALKTYIKDLNRLKKWRSLNDSDVKAINKKYTLTYDVLGIKPKEPILCVNCKHEMVIRNTRLDFTDELDEKNLHIDLRMKCPNCDLWLNFGVPVGKTYFLHIWKLRKKSNIGLTYAPVAMWKENKKIKEKLKLLGYW